MFGEDPEEVVPTSEEMDAAANVLRELVEVFDDIEAPPAAKAFQTEGHRLLVLFSDALKSGAQAGIFGVLAYTEAIDAQVIAMREAAAAFEIECNLPVVDHDDDGAWEIGWGSSVPTANGTAVPPRIPMAARGRNNLGGVFAVLTDYGFEVEYGSTLRVNEVDVPGQILDIDGTPLLVFVYPDVPARQDDHWTASPNTLFTGTRYEGQPALIYGRSNVLLVLISDDVALGNEIYRALLVLP